jgi:hypothetical protein
MLNQFETLEQLHTSAGWSQKPIEDLLPPREVLLPSTDPDPDLDRASIFSRASSRRRVRFLSIFTGNMKATPTESGGMPSEDSSSVRQSVVSTGSISQTSTAMTSFSSLGVHHENLDDDDDSAEEDEAVTNPRAYRTETPPCAALNDVLSEKLRLRQELDSCKKELKALHERCAQQERETAEQRGRLQFLELCQKSAEHMGELQQQNIDLQKQLGEQLRARLLENQRQRDMLEGRLGISANLNKRLLERIKVFEVDNGYVANSEYVGLGFFSSFSFSKLPAVAVMLIPIDFAQIRNRLQGPGVADECHRQRRLSHWQRESANAIAVASEKEGLVFIEQCVHGNGSYASTLSRIKSRGFNRGY